MARAVRGDNFLHLSVLANILIIPLLSLHFVVGSVIILSGVSELKNFINGQIFVTGWAKWGK